MKINEMTEPVRAGLRIKSLISENWGTVVFVDNTDDDYAWVKWDHKDYVDSGFYGNDCECEVGEFPIYAEKESFEQYIPESRHSK